MYEYLWIGIIGLAIWFAIVGIVYTVAKSQGRKSPTSWAVAAVIAGPFALLFLYLWRGDRGAPGETKAPVADPAELEARDRSHGHSR